MIRFVMPSAVTWKFVRMAKSSFFDFILDVLQFDDDDDCFYYWSWRSNVVIAFGNSLVFFDLASHGE